MPEIVLGLPSLLSLVLDPNVDKFPHIFIWVHFNDMLASSQGELPLFNEDYDISDVRDVKERRE